MLTSKVLPDVDRAELIRPAVGPHSAIVLIQNGVEIESGPESHENGKFAWIMDPDGNKVELWEPMLWDDKNKGA